MSNLTRATYRVTHSLRRKAAGEHDLQTNRIIEAFCSEWMLDPSERAKLYLAAVEQERQTAVRRRSF